MFTWVLASGLAIGAPALKDTPKEDAPTLGRWQVESHLIDGCVLARVPVMLARRFLEFDYSAEKREEHQTVAWRVPFFRVAAERQVEVAHSAYEWTASTIQKEIWKVEGDRLTICPGKPGGPRPTEFSGIHGSGQTLIVLVRVGD